MTAASRRSATTSRFLPPGSSAPSSPPPPWRSLTEDGVVKANLLQADSEVSVVEEACHQLAIEGRPFQFGDEMLPQLRDILGSPVGQATILEPTPDHLVGVQRRGIT